MQGHVQCRATGAEWPTVSLEVRFTDDDVLFFYFLEGQEKSVKAHVHTVLQVGQAQG